MTGQKSSLLAVYIVCVSNCLFLNVALSADSGYRHLPMQMNDSSCQSYALGLAAHYEDSTGLFRFDENSDETYFRDIRIAEAKIRTLVSFAKGNSNLSHRGHWKQAIRHYSSVNGLPTLQVKENISRAPKTLPQFQSMLQNHFASRCDGSGICPETRNGNIGTPRPLIVSIKSVHGVNYATSHVVLIKDVRPKNIDHKTSSAIPSNMEYQLENSASRRTNLTCGKSGSREWTNNVTFNNFGGLGFVLTWIEPASQ